MFEALLSNRTVGVLVEALPRILTAGLTMTIPLTLLSFFFAMIIAVAVALVQYANVPVLRQIARFYIWVIRGTPLLVQLFIIFYGLPSVGIMLNAFPAAVIAFAFNEGAYCAETMRGALESVPQGQLEAGYCVGMSWWQIMRRIVLPQALRTAVPALSNSLIGMIKDTSLASNITVAELFMAGQRVAARTYIFLPIYCEVAVVYLLFCTVITKLQALLERQLNARGFQYKGRCAPMAMLEIRNVQKTFRTYAKPGLFHRPGARKVTSELPVLRGVDLTVEKGDVVAILGPSGSGKTTLLRCLNFLETADAGQLVFDGESFDLAHASRADIARLRKKTAFVFQNYNLFRNKTALQNVTEGLIVARKLPKEQADEIGMKMLAKVGLADRADYYPRQLSGGQQQRVAIARALAADPEIIYFDEPTSALDPELTGEVLSVMRQLAEEGMTMLVVTHEMGFARNVSSKTVFMENGVVVEQAPSQQFFASPKEERTRAFLRRIAHTE